MKPASEIESDLVNSIEVATDYQNPEIGPIWAAVSDAVDGLRERDDRIVALEARVAELEERLRGTAAGAVIGLHLPPRKPR